jgi:hypothetical protein
MIDSTIKRRVLVQLSDRPLPTARTRPPDREFQVGLVASMMMALLPPSSSSRQLCTIGDLLADDYATFDRGRAGEADQRNALVVGELLQSSVRASLNKKEMSGSRQRSTHRADLHARDRRERSFRRWF